MYLIKRADVAELADAHGSGPCSRKGVEVQVLSSAPTQGLHQDFSGVWAGVSLIGHQVTGSTGFKAVSLCA
jgi:hypothetical protein